MSICKGRECEYYIENVGEQGECDCIRKTLYDLPCINDKKRNDKILESLGLLELELNISKIIKQLKI